MANPKSGVRRFLALTGLTGAKDPARSAALAVVLLHHGPTLVSWDLSFARSPESVASFVAALPTRDGPMGSTQVSLDLHGHVHGEDVKAKMAYVFNFDASGSLTDWTAHYRGPRFE